VVTAPAPDSRYAAVRVAVLQLVDSSGAEREVRYLRRRFLPPPASGAPLAVHPVVQGDRIDLIAARYLGDATQFWQVCDATRVIHPDDLTGGDRIGTAVGIPFPSYGAFR
jgi:hypothetical protein